MSLEELLEQLQSLVAGHLRPKVGVAPEQLVQIIHGLRSGETPVVVAEVRPVPPKRHPSTEEFDRFIPLYPRDTQRHLRILKKNDILKCFVNQQVMDRF